MKERYTEDFKRGIRGKIINDLIKKHGYKKYLEIGVFESAQNFDNIKIDYKVGVDPGAEGISDATFTMTSDEFFELTDDKFDIIFCDGLHHSEQVYKDIVNSLNHLNEGGVILCHDMNPWDESLQLILRECPTCWWTGDCWKAFVQLRMERDDLEMCVIDADMGLGVIRRGSQEKIEFSELTYENFDKNRENWLNLTPLDQFVRPAKFKDLCSL